MSLRSKFAVLIGGSIFIPLMVMGFAFRFNSDFAEFRHLAKIFSPHAHWQVSLGRHPLDRGALESGLEIIPAAAQVQAYDYRGTLLFERFTQAPDLTERAFTVSVTNPVSFTDGSTGRVVVSTPYTRFNPDERPTLFYVPLTGLVTMAGIAILLGQSINRSINQLERATRRIVQGDLDFKLSARGNDKFASLTRSFDSMREHLKEEYARRARFMMGVSHDLKTPLSSITGYNSAIRDGFADTAEKLEKYTSIIDSKTGLLESRISMLIDFVKQDTKEWEASLQDVDLGSFLREFVSVFEAELGLRQFSFGARIDIEDGLSVPMDADMVVRAFENLAHNAVQYSPEGGRVELDAHQEEDRVLVRFSNEGPGISKEDLPYIFDPFVRGARDRRGSGFGLGLATVHSVMSSHGWTIKVESEPNARTVFSISIPLSKG